MSSVRFRPHHFLCTLGFRGKGYSPEFVENYAKIADQLRAPGGEDVEIEVTGTTDSICGPCPSRRGDLCETEAKIRALDGAHARVLGLHPGMKVTWGEALDRIADRFSMEAHDRACAACSWKSLGVCAESLAELKATRNKPAVPAPTHGVPKRRVDWAKTFLISTAFAIALSASTVRATVPDAGEEPVVPPVPSPKVETDPDGADGSRLPVPMTSGGVPTSGAAVGKHKGPAVPPADGALLPPPPEEPSDLLSSGGSIRAEGPIEDGSKFVDELHRKIQKNKKSKTAEWIKDAYLNLSKERYSQVLALAAKIRKDELFADYGVYMEGEAALRRGKFRFEQSKKKPNEAIQDARLAITRFDELQMRYPESPFSDEVQVKIAEGELLEGAAQTANKQWKTAQAAYQRAFERLIPAGKLVRTELVHFENFASACGRAKNPDCLAWSWRLVDNFPKSSKETAAIAKAIPEALKLKDSAEYADRLTTSYFGTLRDEEAFDEAYSFYMARDYGDAIDKFVSFLQEYPKSMYRHRARYWLARAYERHGDKEKGRTMHEVLLSEAPLTFYGILSALALSKTPVNYVDATLPSVLPQDPYLYPSEIRRLERAERLIGAGASRAAAVELRGFQARRVHSNKFLMYLALLNHQAGNYLDSFRVLGELFNRGYEGVNSSHTIRLIFPLVYREMIQKYADTNRIDPILVLSLMKQESAFQPEAVSRSGALGLMQLMPGTAVDTDPNIELEQLSTPDPNVRVGTSTVARLLRQFGGNIVYTLAGYNAGPGRVKRWRKEFSDRYKREPEMLEFMELIPYKETREYVGAIIRNYYWYSYRLNGTLLTSLDYFWGVSGPMVHPIKLSTEYAEPETELRAGMRGPERERTSTRD